MAAPYVAISKADGSLEIEGLEYAVESCSGLSEESTTGAEFWNPTTNSLSALPGRPSLSPVEATLLLSKTQFIALERLYKSATAQAGTLTAYHRLGTIETILTGVRLSRLNYGEFDKLAGGDACKVQISFTYTGRELQTTGGARANVF